jgi:hypothetical protein
MDHAHMEEHPLSGFSVPIKPLPVLTAAVACALAACFFYPNPVCVIIVVILGVFVGLLTQDSFGFLAWSVILGPLVGGMIGGLFNQPLGGIFVGGIVGLTLGMLIRVRSLSAKSKTMAMAGMMAGAALLMVSFYIRRAQDVSNCARCLEKMNLSLSTEFCERWSGCSDPITVGQKLMQLGAYCEDGNLYDFWGNDLRLKWVGSRGYYHEDPPTSEPNEEYPPFLTRIRVIEIYRLKPPQ